MYIIFVNPAINISLTGHKTLCYIHHTQGGVGL
jgi:hypothetical protein